MSLSIITAAHLRKDIFALFCLSIERLRAASDFDIRVVCVGEDMHASLADKHDIEFYTSSFKEIGYKFQLALNNARLHNSKAVMILGSDDILDTDTFHKLYYTALENNVVAGINQCYFYSTTHPGINQLLLFKPGRMIGPGRTINRSVLDSLDWKLWNKSDRFGLDSKAEIRIKTVPHEFIVVEDGICVDVKGGINMNSFAFWLRKRLPHEDNNVFWNILSEKEANLLREILSNNRE